MEGPTTFPRGVMRYARVRNRPFPDATLIVESQGAEFDVNGRYLHTAWIVVAGETCNGFYQPGDRAFFSEDDLVPVARVNWDRIPG